MLTGNHDKQCQIKWECKTLEIFTSRHRKLKSAHFTCKELQKKQREGYKSYKTYTDRFQAAIF